MDIETVEMYLRDYDFYLDDLKEGDEILSLQEFIECLTSKKQEDEK